MITYKYTQILTKIQPVMLSFLASSLSFLANEASREISNHQICIFAVWIIWIRYKTFMRVTTAGTCIQRAPPPTQDESTSDSEALGAFFRLMVHFHGAFHRLLGALLHLMVHFHGAFRRLMVHF